MAADRYSQVINFLKLALPLSALVILSTLFIISRERESSGLVPFTPNEVRQRVADQQVTGPVFSGLNAAGDALTVTAETMRSTGDEAHEANKIDAQFQLIDGTEVRVTAADGEVNILSQTAALIGDVIIETSGGLSFRTQQLNAALDPLVITASENVQGETPFGTVNAGAMQVTTDDATGDRQMVFTNGVKLIYQPKSAQN